MQIGYKLASEAFGPQELIRQAVLAEQSGFDFVEMSDHYHPWLDAPGHSPFTWSVLSLVRDSGTALTRVGARISGCLAGTARTPLGQAQSCAAGAAVCSRSIRLACRTVGV